jgi:hypothetical protein
LGFFEKICDKGVDKGPETTFWGQALIMFRGVIQLGIAGALLVSSVLVPLAIRRHAQAEEREQQKLVQEQATKLDELSAENKRLSNLVAKAQSADLSAAQRRELLKLRGALGPLRQAAAEAKELAARNRRLAGVQPRPAESSPVSSLPEGQAVQAYWPRGQLAFSGYADPTAALKSALWAMTQADPNALAASVTPEARANINRVENYNHGSPAEELAASARTIAVSLQPAKGFYVVGQRASSEDQVMFDVFFEGEGRTRTFAMKKLGTEWKFNVMGRPGVRDSDVHLGNAAWP